jgi:ketosteroid isomerase-like protein
MDEAKPFLIPKREVWEAFKRVKANQGAAGVDGQSIEDFEANLSGNLYKLWNRMSSGSYFPPAVRRVEIPKASGGIRPLGIPTVADRIAQEVARRYLEPILEPVFHPDSFGYRPGKSAIDAVAKARAADEDAVAKNVEAFRAAQVAADAEALDGLCAAELSYSHSDGRVEDKATFIANATDRKSKFLSLAYQDIGIRVVGGAAIVRFHWVGESQTAADGKKSATNLHVLMNWQKQGADWKLLSRASTKL